MDQNTLIVGTNLIGRYIFSISIILNFYPSGIENGESVISPILDPPGIKIQNYPTRENITAL